MAGAEEAMQLAVRPPNLYPFCIVWTPIPLVTWIVPFVGHLGAAWPPADSSRNPLP